MDVSYGSATAPGTASGRSPKLAAECGERPHPALIERALPARELSKVIAAERRIRDPIYLAHRWWARRPPALMRALLLATYLPGEATEEEFWRLFNSSELPLRGVAVLDPFARGVVLPAT